MKNQSEKGPLSRLCLFVDNTRVSFNMAPSGRDYHQSSLDDNDGHHKKHYYRRDRDDDHHRDFSFPSSGFADPPLSCRPKLFCCAVGESSKDHLPRSFVNPGRHLMNQQLKTFLECADDDTYTFHKCDVSHIVEVTTRVLCNHNDQVAATSTLPCGNGIHQAPPPYPLPEQWNREETLPHPSFLLLLHHLHNNDNDKPKLDNITPPLDSVEEEDRKMIMDMDHHREETFVPYSTHQSMSTRFFITHNSSNSWQVPPHSRQYRDNHPDPNNGRIGVEKYMEIPPLKTMPYTSESVSGNGGGAREWIPSCSILMWCNKHNTFYEVHILS